METKIKEHLNDAHALEVLYRTNKNAFKNAFAKIHDEIKEKEIAVFWQERLFFENDNEKMSSSKKLLSLLLLSLLTTFLVKIPQLFELSLDSYYSRNVGLIILLGLSINLLINHTQTRYLIITAVTFILSAVYINIIPFPNSDSTSLAFIHLPLFLWCFYGIVFSNFKLFDLQKRVEYLKYNGDLAILSALILIAGTILSVVTIGLFAAIGLSIDRFYMEYVVMWGLVSAPLVSTYIIKNYPETTHKMAPLISTIFSPLVLITLVVYLISIIYMGKNPYHDRDFLVSFNIMVLGVMAIIVFTVSGYSMNSFKKTRQLIVTILTLLTFLLVIIALSAILYRLYTLGMSPNRITVLVSNLLLLVNLALLIKDLYVINLKKGDITLIPLTMARYLPVYAAWTLWMTVGFPLVCGYR